MLLQAVGLLTGKPSRSVCVLLQAVGQLTG